MQANISGARVMVHWLKALAVILENLSSFPPPMSGVLQPHVIPALRGLTPSSGLCGY